MIFTSDHDLWTTIIYRYNHGHHGICMDHGLRSDHLQYISSLSIDRDLYIGHDKTKHGIPKYSTRKDVYYVTNALASVLVRTLDRS